MAMTKYRFINIFVTTFRSSSLEEERFDRSKYREYSSRFVLCCLVITVYFFCYTQQVPFFYVLFMLNSNENPQ